jgi:hypothetical protein
LTIDQLSGASTPLVDGNLIGVGQGSTPTQTFKADILENYKYVSRKTDYSPNNMFGPDTLIVNGTFVVTVASNNLTVALKTLAGNDPSTSDPVTVFFRHSTITNGAYTPVKVTAATSFTVNNGNTLGTTSGVAFELWLVGINDTTFQLGLVNPALSTGLQYLPDEYTLKNSTGRNGGNNPGIIYSPSSASSKPIGNLAILAWTSGLSTAGTWSAVPTYVQHITPSSVWTGLQAEANSRINDETTVINQDIMIKNNNIIINGGMEVDQVHAGALQSNWTNTALYSVDLFLLWAGGTAVFSSQQVSDAPSGLSSSLKISVTTADTSIAASDHYSIETIIEGNRTKRLGWGTSGALAVSLGFWVKANRTGTYSGAVNNAAQTRSYPFNFTVNSSGTWEYKTVSIPGDTTGTWATDNTVGLFLFWTMAAGTNWTGTVNTWAAAAYIGATGTINGVGATSDYMQITGVVLIPGSIAPSAAQSVNFIRPFDEELALCQRYYEKSFFYSVAPATQVSSNYYQYAMLTAGATGQKSATVAYKVRKRAGSTVTLYNTVNNNAQVYNASSGGDCSGTVVDNSTSDWGFAVNCTGDSGGSVGNRLTFHWTADSRL